LTAVQQLVETANAGLRRGLGKETHTGRTRASREPFTRRDWRRAAFGPGTWSSSQPRQSKDAGSQISELVFSNDSLKHILPWQPLPTTPCLRGGAR
jgi:hypothetical protein